MFQILEDVTPEFDAKDVVESVLLGSQDGWWAEAV